ncbi:sce7726 family protein [Candidatus Frankia alpina]|uniref:sce7726 family protein n=1 Tax=Candidatus Frankia alpina TaxID=2699483 RepID=UPI0013D8767B|nr:sce7726 family protein [Candidatus Frankia alpina]
MAVLDDRTIRAALVTALAVESDGRVRHELDVAACRVDVAVVGAAELTGYEIKSDRDSLRRLTGQATAYGTVLDRVTLVATGRHLDHAAALVPDWWGLTLAAADETVTLTEVRPAGRNGEVDPVALAGLLWAEEARTLLRLRGQRRGIARMPRGRLHAAVAEAYPLNDLRREIRRLLQARPADWTVTLTGAASR